MEMESLQQLEQKQRMLTLLQNQSLFPCSSSTQRFLVDFLVFMVQVCVDAQDMMDKCQFLLRQLPKISSTFAHEVMSSKNKEGEKNLAFANNDKRLEESLQDPFPSARESEMRNFPLVQLEAMEKAKSTMEDSCKSYFMFHEIDFHKPDSWFKYIPILMFVESYIYQLDIINEELLYPASKKAANTPKEHESFHGTSEAIDSFRPLCNALESRGLMTERIRNEFNMGLEYWKLERHLCDAITSGSKISIEEALRALRFKSFDYRVLNLVMYGLTNRQVNEIHMNFLEISEILVEISDDLYDYEEDILKNNFNILRMFVNVYGPSKGPCMLAKYIGELEENYQCKSNQLDTDLLVVYNKRCEEATKEDGICAICLKRCVLGGTYA
eukprot:TRINITY_DN5378_c0_g1_i9.p1 TRINITY_DN5378_c0_g1~~TRINITY_DN5378_c0_g1_i9.p1  ORF type:complete len:384 (-),score=79.71 TRINITY_DN5378_c0_g1_i9:440-1591(-)